LSPRFVIPAPLCEGDLVKVIAPAGPFDRTLAWRGLAWLKRHFRVHYDRRIFERDGFLAGDDAARLRELNAALRCEQARAVIVVRGGYGCGRIAPFADFPALRRLPKWLVGFSDVTALHCEAQRVGVASLHAENVTGLGVGDDSARQSWLAALTRPPHGTRLPLQWVRGGAASGVLVGGNLAVLHAAATARRFRPAPGSLVFLEEVSEAPYRIARCLSALDQAGVFDSATGILVGHVSGARPGAHGTEAIEVFERFCRRAALPLAWGLCAGHERPNTPLPLGVSARIGADGLTLLGD